MEKFGRRLISVIVCAAIIFGMVQIAYADETIEFSVGSAFGSPGDVVTIDISLANNPGFAGLHLTLNFNTKIEGEDTNILSYVEGSLKNTLGEWDATVNSENPNRLNLMFTSYDREIITDDGVIASLDFRINEDAEINDFSDILIFGYCLDENLNQINGDGSGEENGEGEDNGEGEGEISYSYFYRPGGITVIEKKYTLTVQASSGGGKVYNPDTAANVNKYTVKYKPGAKVTIKAAEDNSFAFDKWSCSDEDFVFNKTTLSTTFNMPEKDITFTANFKPKYKVTIKVTGYGSAYCADNDTGLRIESKDSYFPEGEEVSIIADPYNRFAYWSSEDRIFENKSNPSDDKKKTSENPSTSFIMPGHDVEIKAYFHNSTAQTQQGGQTGGGSPLPITYTISFDSQGGSYIPPIIVVSGQSAGEPLVIPDKDGYIFEGWYTDTSYTKKYDFYSLVNGNIVLYAKWRSENEPAGETFTDVKTSDWFYEVVMNLNSKKIVSGVGGNRFNPNANITRAQFAQILANLANADLSAYQSTGFTDIKNTDWYLKPVAWAFDKGIVNGLGDGRFAPNAPVTREDMAVMLSRYASNIEDKTLTGSITVTFTDKDKISGYAVSAVEALSRAGIIGGKPGNKFDPKAYATRAEACKMIYELIKVLGK